MVFSDERTVWLANHVLPHEPALRAWLGRWRTHNVDVDDIVQETYAVLASRPSVSEIVNPRAYCFQTARSIVLMQLRRTKVVSIRAVEDIDRVGAMADDPSPEQQVSDREQLQKLAEAISDLPRRSREALTLRIVEGLTQREVGQRLGISENAAQKHIVKSIHLLMNIFGRGGKHDAHASMSMPKDRLKGKSAYYGNPRNQPGD